MKLNNMYLSKTFILFQRDIYLMLNVINLIGRYKLKQLYLFLWPVVFHVLKHSN